MGAQPGRRSVRAQPVTARYVADPWRLMPGMARRLARTGGVAAAIGLALLVAPAGSTPHASAADGCADFLAAVGHKPRHVQFVGCAPGHDAQLRVLQATYRVKGAHAAQVEHYLIRHTHMPPLRFLCCGWEPWAAGAQAHHGVLPRRHPPADTVTMASGETLVSRRADWAQIPAFHVRVTRYLDQP